MLTSLEPFTPNLSTKICFLLNQERTEKDETLLAFIMNKKNKDVLLELVPGDHKINQPIPLIGSSKLSSWETWTVQREIWLIKGLFMIKAL